MAIVVGSTDGSAKWGSCLTVCLRFAKDPGQSRGVAGLFVGGLGCVPDGSGGFGLPL